MGRFHELGGGSTKNDQPFIEKFLNFQFRQIDTSNTRLNVNNGDYMQFREKRDRAMNYWKDRVVQDFLPPIDLRRAREDLAESHMRTFIAGQKVHA